MPGWLATACPSGVLGGSSLFDRQTRVGQLGTHTRLIKLGGMVRMLRRWGVPSLRTWLLRVHFLSCGRAKRDG